MKQTPLLIATSFLLALAGACAALPEAHPDPERSAARGPEERIVFGVEDPDGGMAFTKSSPAEGFSLELVRNPMELPFLPTKVDAVTTLPSFQVVCTNGTAGNENLRWQATFVASGNSYFGDQYWPLEDPSYHFYASNAPVSFAPGGCRIDAVNDRDVVGAFLESPRYKEKNNLTFRHLFARLGRFTVTAEEGKTLSDVDIRLTPRSGGYYDLRNGTWSRITVEDPVCVSPSGEGMKVNDLYLVPGTYTLTASWTVWKRGFPTRKERVTADITLPPGEVTDVSTVLGGSVIYPELTLECLESGTIYWKGSLTRSIEYSKDDGDTWTSVTSSGGTGTPIAVSAGDILLFRGYNDHVANMPVFDIRVRSYLYGDITSLVNGTGGVQSLDTSLASLFEGCTGLENHPDKDIILDCTSLVRSGCFHRLFCGCTRLTRAPDLPATDLSIGCYNNMFYGCTSLVQVPRILPATTLKNTCYQSMFTNCSSLRTAPELPATTLADFCYATMFGGCTSLETAPELPARTCVISCYNTMFDGCTSLRRIKCLAVDKGLYADHPCATWVRGIPAGGVFIKHPDNDWWEEGISGIPAGWTVQTATE